MSWLDTIKTILRPEPKILIQKNGPYQVVGSVPLKTETIITNSQGESERWEVGKTLAPRPHYELCRCGNSRTKPYCDRSHLITRFNGTETASRETFDKQAVAIEGPTLELHDVEPLCATARFCMHGKNAWNYTRASDDPAARAEAIRQTHACPSGRLALVDKAGGSAIEPALEPSISLVEDGVHRAMGPLWVKGGIPVVAVDGHRYEIRNRVTLCRCGKSMNKPFCDGSHLNGEGERGKDRIE